MTPAQVIPLETYRRAADLVSGLKDLIARLPSGQDLEERLSGLEYRLTALIRAEQEHLVNRWRQGQCSGKWHLRHSA